MRSIYYQVFPLVIFFSLTPTAELFLRNVFSVVFFLLPAHANTTKRKSDIIADQDSGAVHENSIIFHHVTKVLLAEMLINVDFLVHFPKFDMNLSANLGAYSAKLEQLWSHLSWVCHLDYSYNFQKNDSTFGIDWLLRQFQTEVTLAEHEFIALRNYNSSFLNTEQDTTSGHNRSSRAAPLAMMALASVGLFGSKFGRGTGECRLKGFFGSWQEPAQQNAAYMEKISVITEFFAQLPPCLHWSPFCTLRQLVQYLHIKNWDMP